MSFLQTLLHEDHGRVCIAGVMGVNLPALAQTLLVEPLVGPALWAVSLSIFPVHLVPAESSQIQLEFENPDLEETRMTTKVLSGPGAR